MEPRAAGEIRGRSATRHERPGFRFAQPGLPRATRARARQCGWVEQYWRGPEALGPMRRRDFIKVIAGATAAWPLAARAQQGGRVRRIGIVMPYAKGDTENEARVGALKQELAKLGWTDGSHIRFDEHWTTDNMDRVRAEAAALASSNPDIIIATGGRVIPVIMRLTRSIPMVLPSASDPVGVGWAQSLARPGGNVTGFTMFELSMLGKSLEILKQFAPAIVRVGLIYNPD